MSGNEASGQCNFSLIMQWYPTVLQEGQPYRVEGGYSLYTMCGESGTVHHDFTLGLRHGGVGTGPEEKQFSPPGTGVYFNVITASGTAPRKHTFVTATLSVSCSGCGASGVLEQVKWPT